MGRVIGCAPAARVLLLCVVILQAACGGDVAGPNVESVAVSAPFTTLQAGQPVQLTATATDQSGAVVPGVSITWKSSATTVATVDAAGLVSTLSAGEVTITARTPAGVEGSLDLIVTAPGSGAQTVTMPGLTFAPFSITISAGGTVLFEFPSLVHNVIFNRVSGAPADIQATSSRTVARTFPQAGTFPYDCTLHPGMSGEVIVK